MRLRVFRAGNVASAMSQVRAELGPDALILSTSRIADGVEIRAALEETDAPPPPALAPIPSEARAERAALLAWHGIPAAAAERLATDSLPRALATAVAWSPLALARHDPPVLVAGPPGVGKTLTVARLATRLVLRGEQPIIITTDAERAGAAEQLAAFTRLLGLDLLAAETTAGVTKALRRRRNGEPVLIDTAGSDPSATDVVLGLAMCCSAEIVAVFPAGADVAETADIAAAYRSAGARRAVVTRLDIARRLGAVFAVADGGLALAELGLGPGAVDGLVPATPDTLAQRLQAAPCTGGRV